MPLNNEPSGRVLVTGGSGYIGSHTCIELIQEQYDIIVLDNFANSSPEAISRIEKISGKHVPLIKGDICDQRIVEEVIGDYNCTAVVHFAGLKAVGESVKQPLDYYRNNVYGSLCLLQAMAKNDVKTIVFSSSATVYGEPQTLPLAESHPLSTSNPYGQTKLVIEEMLRNMFSSDETWRIMILRYFNPVGAHESGLIGEDPQGIPNNLMPFIAQVAVGRQNELNIWGNDYSTHDGTGVRDYIHVCDLARGHIQALKALDRPKCQSINLGTGNGYSVMEVRDAFQKASDRSIPYKFRPRRDGDIAECYADPSLAENLLDWKAQYGLDKMCEDHWRWQINNPNGYRE